MDFLTLWTFNFNNTPPTPSLEGTYKLHAMNLRLKKVNELIKQEVGDLVARELDLSREILITVTKAVVSPDLRYADILVSVLPAEKKLSTLRSLNKNVYSLQQKLNKKLTMKPVPKIRFELDKTGEYVSRIDKVIEEIHKGD